MVLAAPMEPEAAVHVDSDSVACDGGGALGHPEVVLAIGADGDVVCPYCSRRFVLGGEAEEAAAT